MRMQFPVLFWPLTATRRAGARNFARVSNSGRGMRRTGSSGCMRRGSRNWMAARGCGGSSWRIRLCVLRGSARFYRDMSDVKTDRVLTAAVLCRFRCSNLVPDWQQLPFGAPIGGEAAFILIVAGYMATIGRHSAGSSLSISRRGAVRLLSRLCACVRGSLAEVHLPGAEGGAKRNSLTRPWATPTYVHHVAASGYESASFVEAITRPFGLTGGRLREPTPRPSAADAAMRGAWPLPRWGTVEETRRECKHFLRTPGYVRHGLFFFPGGRSPSLREPHAPWSLSLRALSATIAPVLQAISA